MFEVVFTIAIGALLSIVIIYFLFYMRSRPSNKEVTERIEKEIQKLLEADKPKIRCKILHTDGHTENLEYSTDECKKLMFDVFYNAENTSCYYDFNSRQFVSVIDSSDGNVYMKIYPDVGEIKFITNIKKICIFSQEPLSIVCKKDKFEICYSWRCNNGQMQNEEYDAPSVYGRVRTGYVQ